MGVGPNDAKARRMVSVGFVHPWRCDKRLLVAVRDLDDGSPAIRLPDVASPGIRAAWGHCFGRSDMDWLHRLGSANVERRFRP